MAIQKTYMLRFYERMLKHVMIDSKRVLCEFTYTSAKNPNYKGTFTTAVPEIIQKLEESPDFNREYYLYKEEEIEVVQEQIQYRANPLVVKKLREEEEKRRVLAESELAKRESEALMPETEMPAQEQDDPEPVINEPVVKADKVFVSSSEAANVQQAKEYLKQKFPELTARQLLNKANVISVADEKGVEFEAIQP